MISSNHAIIPLKVGGRVFPPSEVNSIFLFYFAYISILVLGNIIISAFEYSAVDSLFISASAISTVGLSTLDVAIMPLAVKVVLIFEMLFGRVEIISMAVLIGLILKVPRFKR